MPVHDCANEGWPFAVIVREGERMKFVVSLVAAIVIAVAAVQPSAAEPVPERATGIWSMTECGGDGLTMLVHTNAALLLETLGEQAWVAVARAEWLAGFVVLTMEGGVGELMLPPLDELQRCSALPVEFSVMFAESIAVFRELDALMARCLGEEMVAAECVALVFELVDVSEDGSFSKAELSRAVRAASFFVGYWANIEDSQDSFVPMEKLSMAWFVASALGPLVARNLIDSYDFDEDGRLSLEELLQDRLPEEGIQGLVAGVAAQVPPNMASGLMRTVNSVLEALR